MKPKIESWELHGEVKSYTKKRIDYIEIEGVSQEKEDVLEKESVQFNVDGFLIARQHFDSDLKFQYKWDRKKINNKNFTDDDYVQILMFDSEDGLYCGEHTFKFNKQGFLIQENIYNAVGDLNTYIHHKNDDWGKPLKITQFKEGEKWMIEEFQYNLDGLTEKSKVIFCGDESQSYTKLSKYGNDGIIQEEKFLDLFLLPKYSYSYTYSTDSNKNWTKKFVYQDEKLLWREERKIKYFN